MNLTSTSRTAWFRVGQRGATTQMTRLEEISAWHERNPNADDKAANPPIGATSPERVAFCVW